MAALIALANEKLVPTWLANQKLPISRSANQRTETQLQFTRVVISIVCRFLQLKLVKWTEMDSFSSFLSSLDEVGMKRACKKSKAADDVESSVADIEPQIKFCGSKTSIKEGSKPHDHNHNYHNEKASTTNPPVSMIPPQPTVYKKRRCKECAPCLASDCGQCVFCLDKPKFGGHNIKKGACLHRRCLNMVMTKLSLRKSTGSTPQKEDLVSPALDNIVNEEEPFGGPSEGRKPQRKRTLYTAQQLDFLEEVFQMTSFPDKATRQTVAQKISLPKKKVSCWFKNRRAKVRGEAKKDKSPLGQFHDHDHNYHKLNVVETFIQTGETHADVQSDTSSEKQEAVTETKSAQGSVKEHIMPGVSLNRLRRRSSALVQEDVDQQRERVSDLHEDADGKRKMVQDESFPTRKKLNVNVCFSNLGDDNVFEVQDKGEDPEYDVEVKCNTKPNTNIVAETSLPQEESSSVKVVNGQLVDFRCTICKKLPRSLNKSELYRHYATDHFHTRLMQEYGHLKVCPYCNLVLSHPQKITAHFGQKHSFVENFLPAEAWIVIGDKRRSSGTPIRKEKKLVKKLDLVENKEDLPFGDLCVWPEIPKGFNPYGRLRGLEKGFKSCKQSCIMAKVGGYDIELEKDECCEEEIFVNSSEVSPFSSSAHEQVTKCKICKMKFDQKQQAVIHVQSVHVIMKGSGNVFHDYDVLLRTGYLAHDTSTNKDVPGAPVGELLCPDTAVEDTDLSFGVDEAQSMELTGEEWELVYEVENYQQRVDMESVKLNVVSSENYAAGDKSESEGVAKPSAVKVGLEEGINNSSDGSGSEWDMECVEYNDIPDLNVMLESDEAGVSEKDREEACAVESRKDLPIFIPERESGYSSTPGYHSSCSV